MNNEAVFKVLRVLAVAAVIAAAGPIFVALFICAGADGRRGATSAFMCMAAAAATFFGIGRVAVAAVDGAQHLSRRASAAPARAPIPAAIGPHNELLLALRDWHPAQ